MTANNERKPRQQTLLGVIKTARKAGLQVRKIEVEAGGKVVVHTGGDDSVGDTQTNPWDEVLRKDRRNGP